MKIIKINNCGECPHCKGFPALQGLRCMKEYRKAVVAETIPDWCPLEDDEPVLGSAGGGYKLK